MSRFTRSVDPEEGFLGKGTVIHRFPFLPPRLLASVPPLALPPDPLLLLTDLGLLDSHCFRRHFGPRTAQFGEFSRKKGSKECLPLVVRIAWIRDLAHWPVSPFREVKFVAREIGYSRIAEAFDCCVAGREGLGKWIQYS